MMYLNNKIKVNIYQKHQNCSVCHIVYPKLKKKMLWDFQVGHLYFIPLDRISENKDIIPYQVAAIPMQQHSSNYFKISGHCIQCDISDQYAEDANLHGILFSNPAQIGEIHGIKY